MLKTFIRGVGVVILVAVVAYIGITCYYTFKPLSSPPEVPKAAYSVMVENTGVTVFTDKVVSQPYTGPQPAWASRQLYIYTLPNGYYEVKGGRFVFKKVPLPLDESIFGPIKVTPQ